MRYSKSRILVNFDPDNGTLVVERFLNEHDMDWYCVQDFMRRYEIELTYGEEDKIVAMLEASPLVQKVVSVTKGKARRA